MIKIDITGICEKCKSNIAPENPLFCYNCMQELEDLIKNLNREIESLSTENVLLYRKVNALLDSLQKNALPK